MSLLAGSSKEDKEKDLGHLLISLQDTRRPYELEVDQILTYVVHSRRKIKEGEKSQRGKRTGVEVYDSEALRALNVLVDGMCGYSISRSFRWFSYMLPTRMAWQKTSQMKAWNGRRLDEYPDVKFWLSDYEEAMYAAFLKSNLYDVVPDIVRDAAGVGTASPILEEDVAEERFVIQVPHFRECYLAENVAGKVDTNFRVYALTLKQLKERFSREVLVEADPNFEKKFDTNPYEERKILHAILPRLDWEKTRLDGKARRVAEYWMLLEPNKLLEEEGYYEMPSFSWRWRKNGDELYGRSPVWDAMVEVMTAQQQGRTNLLAGQKMVEPPMVGPESLRGRIRNKAGGWTWVESMGSELPTMLQEKIQLPFSLEMQARTDEKIRDHLQVNFFMMLSQAALQKVELTATQVMEMSGEKAAVLATRMGRMETEFMNPLHDRAAAIEMRARRIPPAPQILVDWFGGKGGRVEVEYLGPFSQIQKRMFKFKGIQAGLAAIGPYLKAFPAWTMLIDELKTGRDLLESAGFPQKDLRDDETVGKLMDQMNQQQQTMEGGPVMAKLLKAIPGLGKGMDKGSILAKLMAAAGDKGEGEGPPVMQ